MTGFAVPDLPRHDRKGVREVILADGKSVEQSLAIAREFVTESGRAILSRIGKELEGRLKGEFAGGAEVDWAPACRAAEAGLHRLVEPLTAMIDEHDIDVLIVAAGMDGALPSVVAGLAPVSVVGLPTSVGCVAGMIANRAAAFREARQA
jgi:NCAIR mutase (PurE)-related protein